ncbi:MAG TPA: VOC family protein, partial [Actinomycetota bacterium]|nr:VOC family protein [Actinomycetota bacterium]
MAVKPIPDDYARVTPYLAVNNATAVLDFAKKVFDAEEKVLMPGPAGKIAHCEFMIGDSRVMLGDISMNPDPTPVPGLLHVYVDDVDKV